MSAPGVGIAAVGRALPRHFYDQATILEALKDRWGEGSFDPRLLSRFHHNVEVKGRHLALPLDAYFEMDSFTAANDAYVREATDLGALAIGDGMDRAGIGPSDVDHLIFVSVTGIATPSIDATLADRLGFRPDVKRTPIFGLGCVGGAAGVARAADYLVGHPEEVSVLLCVELCSLTFQLGDRSMANLVASGLFGDGAAAVVLEGGNTSSRPRILATQSILYSDTRDVMGWEVGTEGFRLVMSAEIPRLVRERIGGDVDAFLDARGLDRSDIDVWIAHPGGPKVLEAVEDALGLDRSALERTWRLLGEMGNLSSASVLMVLGDALDDGRPGEGELALMLAMGPGFSAELVLLEG